MENPLNLNPEELALLRSLESGFYAQPPAHRLWQRLLEHGLVSVHEPPGSPIQLTAAGRRYLED